MHRWGQNSGRPYVVSPHGMLEPWALAQSRLKKYLAGIMYVKNNLRNAAYIHALTASEETNIKSYLNAAKNIMVVGNGLIVHDVADNSKMQDIPSSHEKYMLFVGRIHPKKNIVNFILAWSKLQRRGAIGTWRLKIAGWGDAKYVEKVTSTIVELQLENSVSFIGPVQGQEKEREFISCSATVLPSLSEGLPMAVLESWAYSRPVLMTEACNLPQGLAAGAADQMPTDIEGMAARLGQFLAKPSEELEAMGRAGRRLVQHEFSWEAVIEAYINVYRLATERHSTEDSRVPFRK